MPNELSEDRLDAVTKLLTDFVAETTIDRVHVLAELPGRVWKPVADAPLGERPAVVGRGSLPLELTITGPARSRGGRPAVLRGGDAPACRSR